MNKEQSQKMYKKAQNITLKGQPKEHEKGPQTNMC